MLRDVKGYEGILRDIKGYEGTIPLPVEFGTHETYVP